MKAFVTGATGFIGQHLVERLQRDGWMVKAIVRSMEGFPVGTTGQNPVQRTIGDVQEPDSLPAAIAGCDTVFHLAAKVHDVWNTDQDKAAYDRVNVQGTRNVLRAAVAAGARRCVFFSSVKAMGEGTQGCADETTPPRPRSAYGRSKLAAEDVALDIGRQTGLEVVCLRLPLVYGCGMKGNLLRMVAAIDRGAFPPLPDTPDRRSMVHVGDVVQASMLAARSPAAVGECYLVTDAQAYSPAGIYKCIVQALGKRVPSWSVPLWAMKTAATVGDAISWATGRPFIYDSDSLAKLLGPAYYSSDKIARALGYRPGLTFSEALPDMIASYRKAHG